LVNFFLFKGNSFREIGFGFMGLEIR
jgi:hypothetical protein